MSWNYRVIEFIDPSTNEPWRAIHEVHYDDSGRASSYSESPAVVVSVDPAGEPAALSWVLDRMREALNRPVLVESDFHDEVK